MSQVKTTPGPWRMMPEECDKPYIRIRGTVCGSRHKIANVLTPVFDGVAPRESEETRANARLIAAAPDTFRELAHLVRLLEPLEQDGSLNVPGLATLNGPRDALAKASTPPPSPG